MKLIPPRLFLCCSCQLHTRQSLLVLILIKKSAPMICPLRLSKKKYQNPPAPINVEKATVVKVDSVVFQKLHGVIYSLEMMFACPQSYNEFSGFTNDVTASADIFSKKVSKFALINFGMDFVSFYSTCIMLEICGFLARMTFHIGSIDKHHNINNYRYQIIGGYCIISVGKLLVDTHPLLKSQLSPYLIRPKHFVFYLLVQKFDTYSTFKKLNDAISNSNTVGKIKDKGGLGCTIFFVRLHMCSLNRITVPPNHPSLYL